MPLEPKLVEPIVVEGAEFWRQSTKRPDEPELRDDSVDDVTEPRFLHKLEAILGFVLHLDERISRREKVRIHVDAAVCGKCEIADLVRGLEPATQQVPTSQDMLRPGRDPIPERHVGSGLEALQPALFDQFIAEMAE